MTTQPRDAGQSPGAVTAPDFVIVKPEQPNLSDAQWEEITARALGYLDRPSRSSA
jgi:hypothetical protein